MNIVRGRIGALVRAVLYATEGFGKTTFASLWPNPVFIDLEHSTDEMDVNRTPTPKSWPALEKTISQLTQDAMGCKTIVIDTADWAERLCKELICMEANVKAIGDLDYGTLYQRLGARWGQLLDSLTHLQECQNVHVVMLAHAQLVHVDIPEESGTIDRWEMKLNNSFKINLCQMTKEWATLVLFGNYQTYVVEVDGKHKAQGGEKRLLYSTHHACWDAKQRSGYNLPEQMEYEKDKLPVEISALFRASPTKQTQTNPEPSATQSAPQKDNIPMSYPEDKPAQQDSPERKALKEKLKELLKQSKVSTDELSEELFLKKVTPKGMHPKDLNNETIKRCIAGWAAIVHNIEKRRPKAA